jgi:signal transduction histidine kinase
MNWLSKHYAFPLVIISLILGIVLQLAWLVQLFQAQQQQMKQEVEQLVSSVSKELMYSTIVSGHEQSSRFRQFFLSPEWLQLKQAFDDLKVNDLHSQFNYGITNDSSVVQMRLSFSNDPSKHNAHPSYTKDSQSPAQVAVLDQRTLHQMDSIVHFRLKQSGIRLPLYYGLYDYNNDQLIRTTLPKAEGQVAYKSKRYTYNFKFLHKYQLILPSLTTVVLFRMRYYIASSFLMILLTAGAFYLILRLMHNQRLYAQVRHAFTSNMTHELKTPVATIGIALETIVENSLEQDPERLKSYLEISRSELRRLDLMIEKVLSLDQLDNGSTNLRRELFDVQQGLQQVIDSMQLQIENNSALLTWLPPAEPCFVMGDPAHLTNVFYNLIENGLKHGGKGVKLEINCSCITNEVIISFKDDGPGIAGIYHHQVFERFFRVPAATPDMHNVKGTGLGLNYARQIIEKHGGRVELHSEPGKGSIFTIHLPLAS